jgi:hypothetical protein
MQEYVTDSDSSDFTDAEEFSRNVEMKEQEVRRGSSFAWIHMERLTAEDAKADLEERISTDAVKGRKYETAEGTKQYLYCAWHTRGCKKQWLYFYPKVCVDVYLRENDVEHNHENASRPPKIVGLPDNVRDIAERCCSNFIFTPKDIISEIRRNVAPSDEPDKMRQKIVTFVQSYKKKNFGTATPTLAELADFAAKHLVEPENIDAAPVDEAIVLGFEAPDEVDELGNPFFRLVISSKRLLQHVPPSDFKQIQADATYKLMWQGFPVLVFGSSDANKRLHPVCIAVCAHEREDDFRFAFESLQRFVPELSPQFCLSDGAEAAYNGARQVWPDIQRVMCFSHVFMNCEKKSNSVTDSELRSELLTSITTVQLAPSAAHFENAIACFESSFLGISGDCDNFVQYFVQQWGIQLSPWYEGVHLDEILNNSGIEGVNSTIKTEVTFRERLSILLFMNAMFLMIKKWSVERDPASPNCLTFARVPELTTKDYTEAYMWARSNVKLVERRAQGTRYLIFFSRASGLSINVRSAAKLLKLHLRQEEFASFDDVKQYLLEGRILEDRGDYYSCSCASYKKNYKCAHSLGALVREKRVRVPSVAKTVPIGQRRKRGRPSRARPALQRQPQ